MRHSWLNSEHSSFSSTTILQPRRSPWLSSMAKLPAPSLVQRRPGSDSRQEWVYTLTVLATMNAE